MEGQEEGIAGDGMWNLFNLWSPLCRLKAAFLFWELKFRHETGRLGDKWSALLVVVKFHHNNFQLLPSLAHQFHQDAHVLLAFRSKNPCGMALASSS